MLTREETRKLMLMRVREWNQATPTRYWLDEAKAVIVTTLTAGIDPEMAFDHG